MKKSDPLKVKISGMSCTGCSSRVKKQLEKHPGVLSADVNHETGQAYINGIITQSDLKEIIQKTGFTLVE